MSPGINQCFSEHIQIKVKDENAIQPFNISFFCVIPISAIIKPSELVQTQDLDVVSETTGHIERQIGLDGVSNCFPSRYRKRVDRCGKERKDGITHLSSTST